MLQLYLEFSVLTIKKMKKSNLIYFLIFVSIYLSSCAKSNFVSSELRKVKDDNTLVVYSDLSNKSYTVYDNFFTENQGGFLLLANQTIGREQNGGLPDITVSASMKLKGTDLENFKVKLDDKEYTTGTHTDKAVYKQYTSTSEVNSILPYFGKNIDMKIYNSSNELLLSSSIKSPVITNFTIENGSILDNKVKINKSEDLIIKWNADPSNSNGVYFVIRDGGFNMDNPDLPASEKIIAILADDDGNLIIDKEILKDLLHSSHYNIDMIRGDSKFETYGNEKFLFFSYNLYTGVILVN